MTTKTKTSAKAKKTNTSKPETSKSETSKSETKAESKSEPKSEVNKSEAATSESSDKASDTGGSKKPSAPAREISYFSSVSTDDYRSGWDNVFSASSEKSSRKPKRLAKSKAKKRLPATISLNADEFDPEVRDQLEGLFRQQAKKKRLNYDKLDGNGQVSWQISCHISDA